MKTQGTEQIERTARNSTSLNAGGMLAFVIATFLFCAIVFGRAGDGTITALAFFLSIGITLCLFAQLLRIRETLERANEMRRAEFKSRQIEIKCPACGQLGFMRESLLDDTVNCPTCKREYQGREAVAA